MGCSSVLCPDARPPRLPVLLAPLASAQAVPGRLPAPAAEAALLPGRLLAPVHPEAAVAGRLPALGAAPPQGERGERQRADRLGELRPEARRAWEGEEARLWRPSEHCGEGGGGQEEAGTVSSWDQPAGNVEQCCCTNARRGQLYVTTRHQHPAPTHTAEDGALVGGPPPLAAAAAAASSRAFSSCATDRREGLAATGELLASALPQEEERPPLLALLVSLSSCTVLPLASLLASAAAASAASLGAQAAAAACCSSLGAACIAGASLPATWVLPPLASAATSAPTSATAAAGAAGASSAAASAWSGSAAAASALLGSDGSMAGSAPPLSGTGRIEGLRLASAAKRLTLRLGAGTSLVLHPLLGVAKLPEAALSWAADSRLVSLGAAGGGTTAPAGAAEVLELGGSSDGRKYASAAGSIVGVRHRGRDGSRGRGGTQVVLQRAEMSPRAPLLMIRQAGRTKRQQGCASTAFLVELGTHCAWAPP